MYLLFLTLRKEYHVESPGTNPYDPTTQERFFYCVWHDSMLIPAFGGKHHNSAALTSKHADGSFVAQVLQVVGMSAIRGSTNHISTRATRALIDCLDENHLVITPDGPRGPRRRLSVGIAFLASHSGHAIVPTAFTSSRCWRIKGSWTDLMIPKPFARTLLLAGAPIYVPPDIPREDLNQYVTVIQSAMDQLNSAADSLLTDRNSSASHSTNSPIA